MAIHVGGRGPGHLARIMAALKISPPVNSVAPSIATPGNSCEGAVFVATAGTWTGATSIAGQWYSAGVAIVGATSNTYTAATSDIGNQLSYKETATNAGGSTVATSNSSSAILNGIVAYLAIRNTAAGGTDDNRWTHLAGSTDASGGNITRAPTGGVGSYTFGWTAATSFSDTGATSHAISGQATISGAGGSINVAVPTGVTLNVDVCLGNGSNGTSTGDSVEIRDGTTSGTVKYTITGINLSSGNVADGLGNSYGLTDSGWLSQGQPVTPKFSSSTGTLTFKKPTAGTVTHIRAIRITYPEFSQVTSGTGPYFVNASTGSDTNNGTSSGTAWLHIPGDPGGAGSIPAFSVLADGTLHLTKAQHHRPASYTGRANSNSHLQLKSSGTSGHQITYDATGAGLDPCIDGSQILASWSAAASGDVSSNPNVASIVKKTVSGVTTMATPIYEGETWLAPAQWPAPSNPYDFNRNYQGSDAVQAIPYANFGSMVTEGADNSYAAGYRACTITDSALVSHYGSIDITGYGLVYWSAGNRFTETTIDAYNTATGTISFHIPNPSTTSGLTQPSATTGNWSYAVRYHPFDIRQAGQYGYNLAKTLALAWFFGSNERSIGSLKYGVVFNQDYTTISGINFTRFGTDTGEALTVPGHLVLGNRTTTGLVLTNVTVSQCFNTGEDFLGYFQNSDNSNPLTNFTFTNITFKDIQRTGGMAFAGATSGTIAGYKVRQQGRSSLYCAGLEPHESHNLTWTDIDLCDCDCAHGNGLTVYDHAHDISFTGFLAMNSPRGIAIQVAASPIMSNNRNLTFKNGVSVPRRRYPGSLATVDPAQAVEGFYGETGTLFEGLILGVGNFQFHPARATSATPGAAGYKAPSTGCIIRNCVISCLGAVELPGVTVQNCLIFDELGGGAHLDSSNAASFTAMNSNVGLGNCTDGGGNVYDGSGSWQGVITVAMQQALTRNSDLTTYTQRTLGTTSLPWVIPAYGSTFALADCYLTTTSVPIGQRASDGFASIIGTKPGSSISLPAGQGNNNLFDIDKGVVFFVSNAAAGTYSLVVRETNNTASNTGATTHDTTFTITVASNA